MSGLESIEPAARFYSVTAHDTNFQSGAPFRKGVYIGGAGNIALVTIGGQTVILPVLAGSYIRGSFVRVNATSTTATNIFGLN